MDFDDTEIVMKKGEKEGQLIWTAVEKLEPGVVLNRKQQSSLSARSSGPQKNKSKPGLGRIVWTPDESDNGKGKLEIVNYNVGLPQSVLKIGKTTKVRENGFIGGHGEGMKIGINILLDLDCSVVYYTKGSAPKDQQVGEKWEFFYDDEEELTVKFLQQKYFRAWEDTTVIVTGLPVEFLCLEHYLFLQPPSPEFVFPSTQPFSDVSGYVIYDGPLVGHLFVSGIFVKKQSQLHYGYNIPATPGLLGRDRDVVGDVEELGEAFYGVWKHAFTVKDNAAASKAMRLYLDLFEKDRDCSDIDTSPEFVTSEIAVLLFREFREMHGQDAWFYDEEGDVTELVSRIQVSLRRTPKSISRKLWTMFSENNLVLTVDQKRMKLFKGSKESSEHTGSRPIFLQHSFHLLQCFQDLHPTLRSCRYSFRDVSPRVDIDASVLEDSSMIYINARNLLPTWVHAENETCFSFSELQKQDLPPLPLPDSDQYNSELWKYNKTHFHSLDCDCIANRVASLIEEELLLKEQRTVRHRITDMRRTLGASMPRMLRVTPCIVEHQLAMQLRFEDLPIGGFPDALFRVRVCEAGGNDVLHVYDPRQASSEAKSLHGQSNSMEGIEEASQPRFPLVMAGTSYDHLQILGCKPGTEYSVQVCRDSDLKTLYCLPFRFRTTLCPPQNLAADSLSIDANLARSRLSWDAVDGAESYLVKLWCAEHVVKEISTTEATLEVTFARADGLSATVDALAAENDIKSFEPAKIDLKIAPFKRPLSPTVTTDGQRKKQRVQDPVSVEKPPSVGQPTPVENTTNVENSSSFEDPSGSEVPAGVETADSDDDFGFHGFGREGLNIEEDLDEAEESNATLPPTPSSTGGAGPGPNPSTSIRPTAGRSSSTAQSVKNVEPSVLIRGTRVALGSVVEYKCNGGSQKRYVGLVRELGKHNSFGRRLGFWVNRFEYVSDYLGFSLEDPDDERELVMHSKGIANQHKPSSKPKDDATLYYVKADDIIEIKPAICGSVTYTTESHGTAVATFKCRYMLIQKPMESRISSLPDWMVSESGLRAHESSVPRHHMEYLTVADIYSKGGSKSLGFQMAGFDSVISVDASAPAYNTFSCNFPPSVTHHQAPEQFFKDFEDGVVHIYDATVVLVSLTMSKIQTTVGQGIKDSLVSKITHLLKPPYVVIEMMPSILQDEHKSKFRSIVCGLLEDEYNVTWKVLQSHKQGLPHQQTRVVLMAAKRGLVLPEWPEDYTNAPTVRDALGDLLAVKPRSNLGGDSGFAIFDQDSMDVDSEYASRLSMSTIDNGTPWIFNHGQGPAGDTDSTWSLAEWDAPLQKVGGIVGKHWPCLHPARGNVFTVREMARIMSFPDTFRFMGTLEEQYKLVGTSMPPLLAKMCAEMIKKSIQDYNNNERTNP